MSYQNGASIKLNVNLNLHNYPSNIYSTFAKQFHITKHYLDIRRTVIKETAKAKLMSNIQD